MHIDDPKLKLDIYQKQFERHWIWSQFYHDAEIKVNTSSLMISSFGFFATTLGPNAHLTIPYFHRQINIIGAVIVIVSIGAIISSMGYWRYYEFCDLYAKKFRAQYLMSEELKTIQGEVESKFESTYPILSHPWLQNAHHLVWFLIQFGLLSLGAVLTIKV